MVHSTMYPMCLLGSISVIPDICLDVTFYKVEVITLIKNDILIEYSMRAIDKSYDGIMVLECIHKHTNFTFVVCACYLPPDNSVWGQNATPFFSNIISLLYACNDADAVYLCGDFNARIGNGKDFIEGLDDLDLPDRKGLDASKNSHGDALLEFMRDIKLCILNGRLDPNRDDFTFHSTRGQSVVDYFIAPLDCISYCRHINNYEYSDR